MYPKCSYRYTSQIGYTLCDYGNDNLEAHKKKIRSCCANACPLGLYPESEKMSLRELYERDMKKLIFSGGKRCFSWREKKAMQCQIF